MLDLLRNVSSEPWLRSTCKWVVFFLREPSRETQTKKSFINSPCLRDLRGCLPSSRTFCCNSTALCPPWFPAHLWFRKFRAALLSGALLLAVTSLHSQALDLGTDSQRASGKELYQNTCAHCHGETGDGKGTANAFFRPKPRNFTSGKYKIRTTPSGELPTTEDIKHIIRKGMPLTGMPAFGNLSEEEIENLAYYLKTFNADFEDVDFVPVPLTFEKAPNYSEESAQRGRKVYVANECNTCHGDLGRTDGVSAPTLEDDFGDEKNLIRPADLTKRWAYRGGPTREDIYRTFTTGLNGTPMPSYQDSMSEQDRWDLVDYIYSLSDRDEPNFATTIVAEYLEDDLDTSKGKALFDNAVSAHIPIVGQVIEPGREYYPVANAIEVRALYDSDEIAFLITWNDMSADQSGRNAPDLPVSAKAEQPESSSEEKNVQYSDAVAVQWPTDMPEGFKKPYFILGDPKKSVDLWFADLAGDGAVTQYTGNGYTSLQAQESNGVSMVAEYDAGEWSVIFKQKRERSEGLTFSEGVFIPVSFYVWDGFNREHGIKTGLSSWYSVYLKPSQTVSPLVPMAKYAFIALLFEIALISLIRWRVRPDDLAAPQPA